VNREARRALGVTIGEQQSTIVVEGTKVKCQDINEVILVGGSSHLLRVKTLLEIVTRKTSDQHPQEAVLDAEWWQIWRLSR
jgi:molecular chaperone DnaK (HSP70)